MPKCMSCQKNIQWKSVYISTWFPNKTIQCNTCDSIYKITSHNYISLAILIPMMVSGWYINRFLPLPWSIFIGLPSIILLGLVITLIVPFFVKVERI
ncbi:TIGR04104 family putative zinc finger protein [Ornithinibacillus halotolerans]|uniref:CXXC-20-CXXC protein n=1 Tax=Ornithinibacillus halotolerans TaxID=1274357 RepID=A0A916RU97_9BACI|nr:hypothetical protein GCM10008025_09640 [Ornithinibacillus halotolerans]